MPPHVTAEDLRPSFAALEDFKAAVGRHQIWDGARVALVAIRLERSFALFLLRATLTTKGATVPDERSFFALRNDHVVVAPLDLSLPDLWRMLDELTRGRADLLSSLVGEQLLVHKSCSSLHWYGNTAHYVQPSGVTIQLAKGASQGFHEIFGHPAFERLRTVLRSSEQPYGSLTEIAKAMNFTSSVGEVSNNATPRFEIGAQIPLQLRNATYKVREKGIVLQVRAGAAIPLDRISVSLTPTPRKLVRGTDCRAVPRGDFRDLTYLVPCARPKQEVVVSLQFDDLHLDEAKIPGPPPKLQVWSATDPVQQWEVELRTEFGITPKELEALVSRSVPKKAGTALKLAKERIRDAVMLRKDFPFYAIVAAGSVAEFVLKEHLRRVPSLELEGAAAALGVKLSGGRSRWRMTFDEAARLADQLGLLKNLDKSAVDILRSARNNVHFNREHPPERRQFSGARAMASIVVMLDLLGRPPQKRRAVPALPSAPKP